MNKKAILLLIFFIIFTVSIILLSILGGNAKTSGNVNPDEILKPSKCLKGCVNKECPNGNFCYNCLGKHASCCCYDFQCDKCETK